MTITLLQHSRLRNSTSISATAFWLATSSAEVISSAISSEGFISVDSTITILCFIPPESSMGYIFSTSCDNSTRSSLLFNSGRVALESTFLDSRSSDVIFPIFRVGFMAFMAYCGMMEISLNLKSFILSVSQTGSSSSSSVTRPSTNLMGGVK